MIRLQNVTKFYKHKNLKYRALYNISFDINPGERILIKGKSGSGKTTLLNILGCIDGFDYGEYIFDNEDITNKNDFELSKLRNRNFGFISNKFGLIRELNVFENVALPLLYSNILRKEKKERVDKYLSFLCLDKYKYFNVNDLSRKDQYKIYIARALVGGGNIIIADEPEKFLDYDDVKEVFHILSRLSKQGLTLIISGTNMVDHMKVDKVISLKDGMI